MPYRYTEQIRSNNFTQSIPTNAKFKMHEVVKLRTLTIITNPAPHRKYGPGAVGCIVGMQYNTIIGHLCNRYYVRMERDGAIWPIECAHLEQVVSAEKEQNVTTQMQCITGVYPWTNSKYNDYLPEPDVQTSEDKFIEKVIVEIAGKKYKLTKV